ncbi:MAG: hypothetical protein AB7O96_02475 [Pseudobdellovibrionaceae bacterium]
MEKSPQSNMYLILKVGMLFVALGAVIYGIKKLNAKPPDVFSGVFQAYQICEGQDALGWIVTPQFQKGPRPFPCSIQIGAAPAEGGKSDGSSEIVLKTQEGVEIRVPFAKLDGINVFLFKGLRFTSPQLDALIAK